VVPWSDVSGFSLANVKWPLNDVPLVLGSSFTMSNVALGRVSLAIAAGIAVAFASPTAVD
jgi:thiamine pyrophosphokinase